MELTRSQKRIILMIADAILIYFSGFVAYFFLSEYVLLSDLSFVQTLTLTVVLYFLIGIKTKLKPDSKTLGPSCLTSQPPALPGDALSSHFVFEGGFLYRRY